MPTFLPKARIPWLVFQQSLVVFILFFHIAGYAQKNLYILNRGSQSIASIPLDSPGSIVKEEITQGVADAYDLEFDSGSGKLYWTDANQHQIISGEVSNPTAQTVSDFLVTAPVDIKIDPSGKALIWVDNKEKKIVRANLDGGAVETLDTGPLSNPSAVEFLPSLNLLFYADIDSQMIWVSNLSGNDRKVLAAKDVNYPVRLLVDVMHGKLYWADDGGHAIERINFDGTGREVFYQGTAGEYPFGLCIDLESSMLYWTDYGTDQVMRTPIDNPGSPVVFVSGLHDPVALVILDKSELLPGNPEERQAAAGKTPRLALYPNPADNQVVFSSLNSGQLIEWIKVFDPAGKDVYYQNIAADLHNLDISNFSEGYYSYIARVAGQLLSGHFSIVH